MNDPHGDTKHQKKSVEIDSQTRDVMYDNLNDDDDAYRTDFTFGVEAIEVYLKPKLRGK